MGNEALAKEVLKLIDATTMRALEVPEDQRSAFVDRAIAFLKSTGKFPDDGFLDRLEGNVRARLAQVSSSGGASIVGTG
jgi:hypothetical protein